MDLVITTLGDRAALLRNVGSGNHWLTLELEGTRGNRDGLGAQVRLTPAGARFTARPAARPAMSSSRIPACTSDWERRRHERIEIRWPGGQTQTLGDVAGRSWFSNPEPRGTAAEKQPRGCDRADSAGRGWSPCVAGRDGLA